MAFNVNITGEIVPYAIWEGEGVCNLQLVENQLAEAKGQDLKVNINSPGGDVDEGFLIYQALREYAKINNAHVTTYAKGRCQSIATIIFLAGDARIGNRFLEPFVHEAWTYVEGEAGDLMRVAVEVENLNRKIGKFYEEHTNLTYEDARALMKDGSFITSEEALKINFATQIEEILRPVALNKIITKKRTTINTKNMATKKTEKSFMTHMRDFFNLEAKNEVEVFTSDNDSLVFGDLEEGETPGKGDKATINGDPADGSYTLQDGTIYVFEDGVMTDVIQPEGETEDEDEIANLKAENKALKEQIDAQNKRIDSVVNTHKEQEARWNKLKTVVSKYSVEDEPGEDGEDDKGGEPKGRPKTPGFNKSKGGLAAAAKRLKK